MNFSLIRHLILKDVRNQRVRLILIWLMAYLLPLTNLFQNRYLNDLVAASKTGMIILFCLLIILAWVSAILLDPTCGSNRFLTTRPIKWTTLLASKILFVLMFLWVPVVIFRLAIVWTAGVQLSFADQALYLFETTLLLSAVASIFVLPALFFQRLTTIILFIVGCVFFGYILSIFGSVVWSTLSPDSVFLSPQSSGVPDVDPRYSLSLRISSFLVVCTILALTIVPVGILRYWKPSLAVPITVVFAGIFLSLTYASYWPYQLDQFASDEPAAPGELPSPLRNQIHFSLQNPSWDISRTWNDNSDYSKKNLEFHLLQKLHFDGVARPLLIWRQSSDVEVSLLSGKKLTSKSGDSRGTYSRYYWVYDYLRQACSGITPANPDYENADMTQSFTFYGHNRLGHSPDISDLELPGATIRGNTSFQVARLNILRIMPFKLGARLDLTRQCYEIRQIIPTDRTIKFLLNRSMVPLILRGDLERWQGNSMEYVPFLIINRRTGEILDDKNDSDYYNPFDGLALQWWTLTRKLPPGAPKDELPPLLPSNWLDDADICFFDIEPLGSVNFPYGATVTNIIH
jgi:hypothetical protein